MTTHSQKKKWKEAAVKELKGKPLEALNWETAEGILAKPIYTAEDLEGLDCVNTLSGIAPYLRGPTATMYTNQPGPSANTRDLPPPRSRMTFTGKIWLPGRRAFL